MSMSGRFFANISRATFGDGLAESVVLIEQINLLDIFLPRNVIGDGVELHIDMRIETKMPEIAFLVGQRGILRGKIEVQHRLIRVADVVFGDRIGQCVGDIRAASLDHKTNARINNPLQQRDAILCTGLVVEMRNFEWRFAQRTF